LVGLECPDCGGRIHRSHTRGVNEKIIRFITPYKAYRCRECGWRGWLGERKTSIRRSAILTVISLLVTLLITALIVFYVSEKLS
jgi:DNA-directed RNA polymerase subunit RPC12/RpoP